MRLRDSRIAGRMLFQILLYGGICASLITAIHSYFSYRNDIQRLHSTLESVGAIYSSEIPLNILNKDPMQLTATVRGEMYLYSLCYIEIFGKKQGQDFHIKIGELENGEKIIQDFPLRSHEGAVSGTLVIAADPVPLKQLAWSKGLELFLVTILVVIAFSGGVFFLVQSNIVRHLLFLSRLAESNKSDGPLALDRKRESGFTPDELDLLVKAMNTMRERFIGSLILRNESEAIRTEERALLIALINSIPDLIFYKDTKSIYLGCNTAFEEFVGRKINDLIGLSDFDLFPRDAAEFFRQQDKEIFAIGGPRNNEEWVMYPDGRKILLDTLKTVYKGESGKVLGLIGISRDITGRKEIESELEAAQERFEKAFNASPMMILVLDGKSERCIDVNHCCLKKIGYKKQELLNQPLADLGFWCDDAVHRQFMEVLEQVGTVEELPIKVQSKSGEEISCLLAGEKAHFSGTECILIFLEDLSKRETAEKALLVSENRFRDFANTAADWFWEMDADLCLTYLTGKVEEVMGIEIGTIIGSTHKDMYHGRVEPSDWRVNSDKLTRHEPFWGFEVDWLRPDGNRRWIVLDGKPIFDQDGLYSGYRGAGRDITLRKQTEEIMRRSMKMDAVGKVTGGIAHDFNNIISIIVGNLDFIKRFGNVDDISLKRVEAAAKASERASRLTRQLLDFSRQQARNCQPTDINKVIQDMDSLIARSVTPEVDVEIELFPGLWMTDIDRGDFEDVVLNLIINARDAMPQGGRLQITTGNMILDEYYVAMNPDLKSGEYIQLAVSDTGVGIASDVLEHIFEPFYTTKAHGKGTGLGMSMVYAFTQRSTGSVRVYSEPDVGTIVHIYLPRTTEKIREGSVNSQLMPGLPGGHGTILIVDDEVDLLALAADMLKVLGYTTLTAKNGNEAIALLLEKSVGVDLLFTDVIMPGGMNGFELAEQALLLEPNLKILFTSGYIEKAVPKIGQFSFSPKILLKPYNELDLAIRISEVLHE